MREDVILEDVDIVGIRGDRTRRSAKTLPATESATALPATESAAALPATVSATTTTRAASIRLLTSLLSHVSNRLQSHPFDLRQIYRRKLSERAVLKDVNELNIRGHGPGRAKTTPATSETTTTALLAKRTVEAPLSNECQNCEDNKNNETNAKLHFHSSLKHDRKIQEAKT